MTKLRKPPLLLSLEQKQEVAARYAAEGGAKYLAQEFGIAALTVFQIHKRSGLPSPGQKYLRQRNQERSQKRNQEIQALYRGGEPVKEIARAYDIGPNTVRLICRGIQRPRRNQERNREITRRYIAGESLSTLAKAFHLDQALIWRIAVAGGAPRYSPERHNRGPEIVRRIQAGEGVAVTPRYSPSQARRHIQPWTQKEARRNRELVRRYNTGEPVLNIIQSLGISSAQLYQILKQVGVPLRNHKHRSDNPSQGDDENWFPPEAA